jgi:3-phosphoshikimate 1-carboxyvinyltransferase
MHFGYSQMKYSSLTIVRDREYRNRLQYKKEFIVESDWSAASYYYSIVALSQINTQLTIKSLFKNSLQADSACANIYKNFGVETYFNDNEIRNRFFIYNIQSNLL